MTRCGGAHAPLSPCALQLNLMERVWLHLLDRARSRLRLMDGYNAIVGACCAAGNTMADAMDHIRSRRLYPVIRKAAG